MINVNFGNSGDLKITCQVFSWKPITDVTGAINTIGVVLPTNLEVGGRIQSPGRMADYKQRDRKRSSSCGLGSFCPVQLVLDDSDFRIRLSERCGEIAEPAAGSRITEGKLPAS